MKEFIRTNIMQIGWTLGVLVTVLPIVAWLSLNGWMVPIDNLYELFPPLGLVAFGLMWTHFVLGALRRFSGAGELGSAYMSISMGMVLSLLILHPGLLWLALYQDGLGLPPFSHYEAYMAQAFAVTLGSIGLGIFLAFELKRFFGDKSWWRFVEYAQILGMAAIFVHAIQLGQEVQDSWFMYVWYFYGLSLGVSVLYSYRKKRKEAKRNE